MQPNLIMIAEMNLWSDLPSQLTSVYKKNLGLFSFKAEKILFFVMLLQNQIKIENLENKKQ